MASLVHNVLISDMIRDQAGVCCVWVGAADTETEGRFVWVASGLAVNVPSGVNGGTTGGVQENCIEIYTSGNSIFWNDNRCLSLLNYICMF